MLSPFWSKNQYQQTLSGFANLEIFKRSTGSLSETLNTKHHVKEVSKGTKKIHMAIGLGPTSKLVQIEYRITNSLVHYDPQIRINSP